MTIHCIQPMLKLINSLSMDLANTWNNELNSIFIVYLSESLFLIEHNQVATVRSRKINNIKFEEIWIWSITQWNSSIVCNSHRHTHKISIWCDLRHGVMTWKCEGKTDDTNMSKEFRFEFTLSKNWPRWIVDSSLKYRFHTGGMR